MARISRLQPGCPCFQLPQKFSQPDRSIASGESLSGAERPGATKSGPGTTLTVTAAGGGCQCRVPPFGIWCAFYVGWGHKSGGQCRGSPGVTPSPSPSAAAENPWTAPGHLRLAMRTIRRTVGCLWRHVVQSSRGGLAKYYCDTRAPLSAVHHPTVPPCARPTELPPPSPDAPRAPIRFRWDNQDGSGPRFLAAPRCTVTTGDGSTTRRS